MFLSLWLLMAGIEPNPGPDLRSKETYHVAVNRLDGDFGDDSGPGSSGAYKRARSTSNDGRMNTRKPRTEAEEIHDMFQNIQCHIQTQIQTVLSNEFGRFEVKLQNINARMDTQDLAIGAVQSAVKQNDKKIRNMDMELRSLNLILFKPVGAEDLDEEGLMDYLEDLICNTFKFDKFQLGEARYLYKAKSGPSPILFKVGTVAQKRALLRLSKCLKGTPTYLKEDFPLEVREARKRLEPWRKKALQGGRRAHLRYDELWIDGERVENPELYNWAKQAPLDTKAPLIARSDHQMSPSPPLSPLTSPNNIQLEFELGQAVEEMPQVQETEMAEEMASTSDSVETVLAPLPPKLVRSVEQVADKEESVITPTVTPNAPLTFARSTLTPRSPPLVPRVGSSGNCHRVSRARSRSSTRLKNRLGQFISATQTGQLGPSE